MTAVALRLSAAAIRALDDYSEQTGLGLDEAVDGIITASLGQDLQAIPRVEEYGLGEVKDRFLSVLRELGSVSGACEATAISEGLPYGWASRDLAFARAFDQVRGDIRNATRRQALGLPAKASQDENLAG